MYDLTILGVRRIEEGVLLGRAKVRKENQEGESQHIGASSSRLLIEGLL